VFEPPTTVCRPAAGACDRPEVCPGNGPACPPDTFDPATEVCRPAAGACDRPEVCPGNGPACPPDTFDPATEVCRPAEGDCDRAEVCPGNGPACPPDTFDPATEVCRPAEGECDVPERCPGNGPTCPPDGVEPVDTPCGSGSADECQMPGHCPGPPGKACVEGEPAPDGTSCSDEDNNVCAPAVCVDGMCVRGEAEVGCGDLPTAPCQVAVDNPPGVFSSLRAAISAAANGTTITVSGLCDEDVTVSNRQNLTIQGIFGSTTCPAAGLRPGDLLAAVRGSLQIRSSTGIVVRFLDIIEAGGECVRLRSGRDHTVHCNCLSLCRTEGVEVNGTRDSEISGNLIKDNRDDGVALLSGSSGISLLDNVIQFNADDGVDVESGHHIISGNNVSFNGHDGIDMDDSDENRVVGNDVIRNGCIPSKSEDSGIEVRNSDDNEIDGNMIRNNPDGETDTIFCRSGSDGNFGSNVPADSSCR
jgi:parallel beta-helix repeat protein